MKIFLTGATGFLGQYLVKELSPRCEKLFILSRSSTKDQFLGYENVEVIKGDITQLEVVTSQESKALVLAEADIVIHAAALYDIKASYTDCYLQNVLGTQNILHLIHSMKKLKAFYYISTIAVGDEEDFFLEEDSLPKRRIFKDYYSETKYLAEKYVREHELKIPIRIIRPGIIVGDSVTGHISKVDGPYYFIEAFKKYHSLLKSFPVIPLSYRSTTKIPMIPVDHCARFITLLIFRDVYQVKLKTYHLISFDLPTVRDFLEDLKDVFSIKSHFIPVFQNQFHSFILKILGIPKEVVPFMFSRLSYDKSKTLEDLPELKESTYPSFKAALFGNLK